MMLEVDDIQHFLISRPPALAARYEFLTFRRHASGHERLKGLFEKVGTAKTDASLNPEAFPPLPYAHEHFGYRDRLSQPCIEGMGEEPTPGSGPPIKPGEFFLGYPDEEGPPVGLPEPEVLSRNGSYVAYLRLEEHVGALRDS